MRSTTRSPWKAFRVAPSHLRIQSPETDVEPQIHICMELPFRDYTFYPKLEL